MLDNLTLAVVGEGQSGSNSPSSEAFSSPSLSLMFGITTAPNLKALTELGFRDQVPRERTIKSSEFGTCKFRFTTLYQLAGPNR